MNSEGARKHKMECDSNYNINLDFIFTVPLNGPSEVPWREFDLATHLHLLTSSSCRWLFNVCSCNPIALTLHAWATSTTWMMSRAWDITRAPKNKAIETSDRLGAWTWVNALGFYLRAGSPSWTLSSKTSLWKELSVLHPSWDWCSLIFKVPF